MTTRNKEELTPAAQEIVPAIRKQQGIQRRRPFLNAMIFLSIAAIVAAGIYGYASLTTEDSVLKETGTSNSRNITDLQEQMKGVCRKVTNPNQLTPDERDGCYRAENSIPPSNVTITQQPTITITGLNSSDVQTMINQAVASLPKPLTVDQVTAIATTIYQANKPKEFTQADIAAAVLTFCGETKCQGQPGKTGEPGKQGEPGVPGKDAPPATPEQILEQVNNFCSNSGKCVGPQGVGIYSISNPYRRESDNQCVLRVEYDAKTAGGLTNQELEVSQALCGILGP